MGIGFLFPYNSTVTAVDFFQILYGNDVDFYVGWLLLMPNIIILGITLKYGFPFNYCQRIVGTFILNIGITICIPLIRSKIIMYLLVLILGCVSSILQGTLFALVAIIGPHTTSIFQTGMGFSGVIVGGLRIITKLFINDITISTYLYFLIAILMCLINVFIYILFINRSNIIKHKINKTIDPLEDPYHGETSNIISVHSISITPSEIGAGNIITKKIMNPTILNEKTHLIKTSNTIQQNTKIYGVYDDYFTQPPMTLTLLFKKLWKIEITIFINWFITLSLFPGVISLMTWNIATNAWFAIIQIFIFNFTDTIGKYLPRTKLFSFNYWNQTMILIVEILRFIFIPLFVLTIILPNIFNWYIALIINILMGFTNGYCGTIAMCLSTKKINDKHKDRVGSMNVFLLTVGLALGSSFAFIINFFIKTYS